MVLTPTILSTSQMEVLDKGLLFSPDSNFDHFQTIIDVNRFLRLLMVKRNFFLNDNETQRSSTEGCSSPIFNEFSVPWLMFREQLAVKTLQNLDESQGASEQRNSIFMVSNPKYYPMKSRVRALDLFQAWVEKDLHSLGLSINQHGNNKP